MPLDAPAAPATPATPGVAGAARLVRLADARVYLCTDARDAQRDLPDFLDAVLGNGVDIVQLRQKGMEARAELSALEVFADGCARHGALLAVNDRADLAYAAGADILHLGQEDLPVSVARDLCGPDILIGRSTHAVAEVDAAGREPGSEYYCVGPCWPTPTKPGRPAPGLDLVTYAGSQGGDKPWFAIGGIDFTTLDAVLAAGARRVVVVRVLTEAADPGAAARELAGRLRAGDHAA